VNKFLTMSTFLARLVLVFFIMANFLPYFILNGDLFFYFLLFNIFSYLIIMFIALADRSQSSDALEFISLVSFCLAVNMYFVPIYYICEKIIYKEKGILEKYYKRGYFLPTRKNKKNQMMHILKGNLG